MLTWHESVKSPSSGDSELERAKNPRCDNFFSIFSIINNDLRDTDISRYFAVTEFNNFLSFDHNIFGKRSDLPFSRMIGAIGIEEGEKCGFIYVIFA